MEKTSTLIEYFESLDRALVLAVNQCYSPFLDQFMWLISGKLTWIPLYLVLLVLVFKNTSRRNAIVFVFGMIITVALADLFSAQVLKESIARYRPSHNTELTNLLHFHSSGVGEYYRGGLYGFVSNHATNFAAIAVFFGLAFGTQLKRWTVALFTILVIVSYSRMYLGVHYLTDILGGWIVGGLFAYLVHTFFYKKLITLEK
ncbi:MAG: undecaprenyl-diphosphatase [Lentimonas sp.]|jgi:undecaprenyl-diphosphatase